MKKKKQTNEQKNKDLRPQKRRNLQNSGGMK